MDATKEEEEEVAVVITTEEEEPEEVAVVIHTEHDKVDDQEVGKEDRKEEEETPLEMESKSENENEEEENQTSKHEVNGQDTAVTTPSRSDPHRPSVVTRADASLDSQIEAMVQVQEEQLEQPTTPTTPTTPIEHEHVHEQVQEQEQEQEQEEQNKIADRTSSEIEAATDHQPEQEPQDPIPDIESSNDNTNNDVHEEEIKDQDSELDEVERNVEVEVEVEVEPKVEVEIEEQLEPDQPAPEQPEFEVEKQEAKEEKQEGEEPKAEVTVESQQEIDTDEAEPEVHEKTEDEKTLDDLFNDSDFDDEDANDAVDGFRPSGVDISIVENNVEILMAEKKDEAIAVAREEWMIDFPGIDPDSSEDWKLELEEVAAQYDEDFMAAVKKASVRVATKSSVDVTTVDTNTNTGANNDNDHDDDNDTTTTTTTSPVEDEPVGRDRNQSTASTTSTQNGSVDVLVAELMENKRTDYIAAALLDWQEDHPDESPETSESWQLELNAVSTEFEELFMTAVTTSRNRLSVIVDLEESEVTHHGRDVIAEDEEEHTTTSDPISTTSDPISTTSDPISTTSEPDEPLIDKAATKDTDATPTPTPTPTPTTPPEAKKESSTTSSTTPSPNTSLTGWFRKSQGNAAAKMGKVLRYFVLDNTAIKYYSNDKHTKEANKSKPKPKPRGLILLSKQTQVAKATNMIIIHTPTRTWKLLTENPEQATEWVNVIVEKLKLFDRYALPVPEEFLSPPKSVGKTKQIHNQKATNKQSENTKEKSAPTNSKTNQTLPKAGKEKQSATHEGVAHGTIRQGGGVGGFTNTELKATSAARFSITNAKGKKNFVALKINIQEMSIEVDSTATCKLTAQAIIPLIHATEPRYYYIVEGNARVFIYCCPSDSARKPRMLYSTGKKSAIAFVTSCKQKLSSSLEIQGSEDITEEELRPSTASVRNRRAKARNSAPKGGGKSTSKAVMAEPGRIAGSLSMMMTKELGSNNTCKKKIVMDPGYKKAF